MTLPATTTQPVRTVAGAWDAIMHLMGRWIQCHDMTRLFRCERTDGQLSQIILGYWKFTRDAEGETRCYIRQLTVDQTDQWQPVSHMNRQVCPDFQLWPFVSDFLYKREWEKAFHQVMKAVFTAAQQAITSALPPACQKRLTEAVNKRWNSGLVNSGIGGRSIVPALLATPVELGSIVSYRTTQAQQRKTLALFEPLRAMLSPSRYFRQFHGSVGPMKCLNKALWDDIIDREAMSFCRRIFGFKRLNLSEVLNVQLMLHVLREVAATRPQWLPLLGEVHPDYWHDLHLFSVSSRRFRCHRPGLERGMFNGMKAKASFRFLASLSPAAHRTLVSGFNSPMYYDMYAGHFDIDQLLAWLSAIRPQDRRPTTQCFAIDVGMRILTYPKAQEMATAASQADNTIASYSKPMASLARRCIEAHLVSWAEEGYAAMRSNKRLLLARLDSACDWMFSTETSDPDTGKPTLPVANMNWASIMRHVNAWHEDRRQQQEAQFKAERRQRSWTAPLMRFDTDSFGAIALTDAYALYCEGRDMHHCVASYANNCVAGSYQVYHLASHANDNARPNEEATLGLSVVAGGRRESMVLHQLYGPCNALPSRAMETFAHQVVARLNQLLEHTASPEQEPLTS
ncbi:PcfJ domain-containing protein [Carnimonas bestiolae]|uniref:PcfJ domain-containing protein n=1 Tax=Carnimonas bestiolae TaxID=3402172 RepID=UPI003EDC4432